MAARTAEQRLARLLLALILFLLALTIARAFLPALIWAVVIAVAIAPLHARAERRWPPGRHNLLLPLLFTLSVALVIILPLALAAIEATREIHELATWVGVVQQNGIATPGWVGALPVGRDEVAAWWHAQLGTPEAASAFLHRIDASLVARSRALGSGALHRVVIFAFTLLALFFLLRDRDVITAQLRAAGERAFGPSGERIAGQVLLSVRGTIDGLVLVGLGEGVLLTVAYLMLGVPHPLLLGTLTGIAAIIPFGAPLLFCLAALLLVSAGQADAALLLIAFGFLIVFIADHFLRPYLIGGTTRLPFLWVLIGILGGV
ncbi:MAG TPA: AI-2E family transporter, partial [Sphingomonadaceae bacterium]|nr:AI-2E family transporter [Sphingomonadaceae bacterium]